MQRREFQGGNGLTIVADVVGPENGAPVVLMHGGGQTRHSWRNGLNALAARGYWVMSMDSRGHGQSGWDPQGDYTLDAQVADLVSVLAQIPPKPALVGASMGGITAMAAVGEQLVDARALVLVDVTPRIDEAGGRRIGEFMSARPEGFETLEEVADAVSAYNPHRPRPKDISGLRRNLREVNGRFFWHWDPKFMGPRRLDPVGYQARLDAAASRIAIPTLLVRGTQSNIVGEAEVAHFRELVPKAAYVDVLGAGHMVAGDRNDAFNAAILSFLADVDTEATP